MLVNIKVGDEMRVDSVAEDLSFEVVRDEFGVGGVEER
jgi:hypothetical protein